MGFVDHLKNIKAADLLLEVAFGRHVIAGDLAKSIVTGVSPTHVVKIQQMLGDAFGKGWSGPEGIWFRSFNRDSSKYKFYPGIMSPGNGDAVQGIDSVFDKDTPHSNTAWIRVECPNGSETGIPDFDTLNNPPIGLDGIYKCQLGDIYDASGSVTASNQFITNAADVLAFGCKEIRRYDNSRIDFASLATLRTACDQAVTPDYTTLPQGVGLTGRYYDGSAFNTFKSKRIDPVIQYDLSTGAPALDITPTGFSVRWEGKIRFKYTETYTMYLTHNDSGKLWIDNLTTAIIDQAAAGTHSATFAATADTWYDIKMEWTNAASDSQFMLEWQSTTQARQVVPQDRLYPKNEAQKRFETHVAFTQRTDFDSFLRQILFTCNGGFQDVGGQLKFFCIDDLTPSFAFTEANIVKGTFNSYPRFSQQELLSLPNRFIADGRDLDSRYLEKFDPPLFYDVPELQDAAGRIIEETVLVGNTTRWQGLSNLAHYAKRRTSGLICEFDGMPQTLPVLPGDVVTVTHSYPGWTEKQFLCIDAIDKSIDTNPDERIFKLLEWAPMVIPPPPSMPTAGLFIHLKADAITGLADGDPVASWTDSSGNSRHATQSTAGSKPIYKTNILNGKPVVRFDGADDFLNLVDLSALTEGEIFIVVKINNDPPTNEFKAGLWYIGSEPNGSVLYPSTDSIIYDSFGTTVRKAVGNPTPSLTSFRIYSVYSAPNDWQSFLDGFSLFSTSTSTVGFNSAPTLGKSRNPTQAIERFLDGDVAEVIFYNHKLSTSVRSDVQGYLNAKYFV